MIQINFKQSFLVRTAALAGCFLFLSALAAQTPSYFPLEVGNTWMYRAVSIVPGGLDFTYQSIRVRGTEKISGREYFDVSYFGRDVILRAEPSTGDILLYDQATGAETPWVSPSLPVGATFPTSINPCPTEGQIISRDGMIAVAGGDFPNVVQVKFQGSCADVGVTTQYYGPNVGLLIDDETTLRGRLTYRLVYYRVGNSSGGPEGEVSFTLGTDFPQYFVGTALSARLTLRNNGLRTINLHFTSGQSYDFKILNDRGEAVYTWSSDKTFLASVRDEKLGVGELTYGLTVPLAGLPPGKYIAQGFLTTDPLVYLGQVGFEIVATSGNL